jgi:hypothetical protein
MLEMTDFEAVLHYGITRRERPSAAAIRDLFFAAVLDGEDGKADTKELASALMLAYIAAWELEHDDDEPLDLLDFEEAEQVFQEAYASAYGGNVPDGLGWFECVRKEARIYPRQLMIDSGHLLARFERHCEEALQRYLESDKGRAHIPPTVG